METFCLKNFSKGEIIIKEGEKGDRAFIINRGEVHIVKFCKSGAPLILATLGPGQIFGEMCLFDAKPRSASAIAATDLQMQVIYKDQFLAMLRDVPREIRLIMVLLINRLRQTTDLVSKGNF